jgi:DNA repair protein RadC
MYRIPRYSVQLVREKSMLAVSKKVGSPSVAYEIAWPNFMNSPVEKFSILLLDTKNKVIGLSDVSSGVLDSALVHPRDVFQRALLANAAALILLHNHPSGDTVPSQEDIKLTKRLAEAGKMMGIPVLDHVIVGDFDYTSLKGEGLI